MPIDYPRIQTTAVVCILFILANCGQDSPTKPQPPSLPTPTPPPPVQKVPTRITITPALVNLSSVGATSRLTARVLDQNGQVISGAQVTWSSSDASVATVNAEGLVTAAGNGTAMITARSGNTSASVVVTVSQTAGSIVIAPEKPELMSLGETVQLTAIVRDGNDQPIEDAQVTWSSSDASVATVNAEGLVTAAGNGTAMITARSGNTSASVVVTVSQTAGSIVIAPEKPELMSLGETVQLTAIVRDGNGQPIEGAQVTWSSSDASVATVNAEGLVTAAGNGTAMITARSGNTSASVVVTVSQTAGSIVIAPEKPELMSLGETVQLTAIVRDGNDQPIEDAQVTWSSSDASVATVNAEGLVTAAGNGTAMITARSGNTSASVVVTVSQTAGSIVIAPEKPDLMSLGETVQLTAIVLDGGDQPIEDARITWSSSDASVATVNAEGMVTAIGNGTAMITARSGNTSASVVVTVSQTAGSIVIAPEKPELMSLGETVQLTAIVRDGNGQPIEGTQVTWSSSDASVATVNAEGLVTAAGNGTAMITARSGNTSASVVVTVSQTAGSIVIAPEKPELMSLGETVQLTAIVRDGNDQPIEDAQVTWSSSDASVATVNAEGLVTAAGNGTAMITARSGNTSASVVVTVRATDRDILVAIYNDTEGHFWKNDTNWLSDAPLDQWYGVTANSDGRVTEIVLQNNNLHGRLTPEIVHLEELTSLQLNHNRISGEIPSALGELSKIEILVLSSNLLTGSIPFELSQLTELKRLVLSFNRLSGSIPPDLRHLDNLEVLSLSVNELAGPLPSELGQLQSLVSLRLDQNQLSGSIPSELSRLIELKSLVLTDNVLTGEIPFELTTLTNLEELFLDHNQLTGLLPAALVRLSKLIQLRLSGNDLSGSLPPDLGQLSALSHLRLSGNSKLIGILPRSLTSLALQELLLEGTNLCAPVDADFQDWLDRIPAKNITNCTSLESTALAALYHATDGSNWGNNTNWLSNAPVGNWYGVSTDTDGFVTSINLENNNLNGYLPVELTNLTNLKTIDLNSNELLSGSLSREVTSLDLETLLLEGTGLCVPADVEFQAWISTIPVRNVATCTDPDLTTFDALFALFNSTNGQDWTDRTNWNSEAPVSEWFGVTVDENGNIIELDLSSNNLSGTIPSELAQLVDLKKIDFSLNIGLWGPLPPALTGLELESLLLHGTQVCAPLEAALQAWLGNIAIYSLEECTEIMPDWFVLAALYKRTDGSNWNNNENWLSDRSFDEWYGVEIDDDGRITALNLSGNSLSGNIPPEIGQLASLTELHLYENDLSGSLPEELGQLKNLTGLIIADNSLSGSLPVELGQLKNLTWLNLTRNNLSGPLPGELGQLKNLTGLIIGDNNLSGSLPVELGQLKNLTWLDLTRNNLSGPLPVELGQLKNLTGLSIGDNNLSGSLPVELGQLTNLTELFLASNRLSGPLPVELGQLKNLERLYLNENNLSGPLPSSLGGLTSLEFLNLASNAGLSGSLPQSFTNLPLQVLQLGGTSVCVPVTPLFRVWIQNIQTSRAASCIELTGSVAYLTQATQSIQHPVPLVAGESALLRVFLTSAANDPINTLAVQATFYQGDQEVHVIEIQTMETRVPDVIDEGDLLYSANEIVPGSVVMPGLEMVVDIDPKGLLDTSSGVNMRIPTVGRIALDVRSVPPLNLTLVPFLWMESPQVSVLTDTEGLSAEDELFWQTRNLLPIADFEMEVREPVWTSTDPVIYNSNALLQETVALRAMDGSNSYYMGILRAGGGQAELPGTSSVSILDAETIAHEIGHNLNLNHSPCGGAGGPDPNYPYEDGSIGSWGYDVRDRILVPPETADLMSYCHPQWISEYGFTRAINYRGTESQVFAAAAYTQGKGLLIWGGVDESGELVLEPGFVVDAVPSLPGSAGPYQLTGEAMDGSILFTLDFGMSELGDGEGNVFAFVVPVQPDWANWLSHISFSGPEGIVSIDREGGQPAAILTDSSTGRVRGLLRNWLDPSGVLPSGRRLPPEPDLEITVSTGVPESDSW